MSKSIFSFVSVLYQLIRRDFYVFIHELRGKFFDTSFVLFTNILVFGYVFEHINHDPGFASFIFVGAIASFGFFEIVGRVATLISDMNGNKVISYHLTLPVPSSYIFINIAISWAICTAILSVCLIPIGKILLFNQFSLSAVSYMKFVPFFLITNLFFGFFSLWLSSIIKDASNLGSLWMRVINPLFMFSGYFYTWKSLYGISKVSAILNLVNPLLYIMEGMRVAMLGPKGYLPYSVCIIVVSLFTIVFGFDAIKRMKKRLDCV